MCTQTYNSKRNEIPSNNIRSYNYAQETGTEDPVVYFLTIWRTINNKMYITSLRDNHIWQLPTYSIVTNKKTEIK